MTTTTIEEFLLYSIPNISRATSRFSSTKTTIPSKPHQSNLSLSSWSDFVPAASEIASTLISSRGNEVLRSNPLYFFSRIRNIDLKVACENDISRLFCLYIAKPLIDFADCMGLDYVFTSRSNDLILLPDSCLIEVVNTKEGVKEVLKTVLEFKTPWAFPSLNEGNLASAYNDQVKAAKASLENPHLNSGNETKLIRVVSQLWAYLSVNHLRYGVLSTYSDTYFFRRCDSTETEDCLLEVSPAISIENGIMPVFSAWFYFLNLLHNDFIYSSPYSTPTIQRRTIAVPQHIYDPVEISLGQLYFNSPFSFGATSSVTTGRLSLKKTDPFFSKRKNLIFKVYDGSKGTDSWMLFKREIFAYQKLDSVQGKLIPQFCRALIASGFVYIIVVEHCGEELQESDVSSHSQDIVDAYKTLHALGVVHNDVAKRNILVQSNKVKLIDFGQAYFKHEQNCQELLEEERFLSLNDFEILAEKELKEVHALSTNLKSKK